MGRDKFSIIELERPLGHAGGDPKPAVGFFRRACPKDNTFSIPERSSLIMEAMGMVVQREHTEWEETKHRTLEAPPFKGKTEEKEP